ncbi:MAG: hypothetical protein IPK52_23500 [Chloroflexi bacterium]|nr:hypothetical protein [Chloroflexota bacterium]
MDLQITYSAQYGLEWRVVLPERPVAPRASSSHDFRLPDDLPGDEFPTQEARVLPELKPRVYFKDKK